MSIFPFIQPQAYTEIPAAEEPLPLYRDIEWNFERNKPVFVRGEPVIVSGLSAVMSWAWRALHQERFVNEIYTWNYGNELLTMIGQQWLQETKLAEAVRYIRECLMVSPYIKGVNDIRASFEDGLVTIACRVVTVYGEQGLEVGL